MRSRSKYILILLILLVCFGKSYSEEIKFEAKEINITNEGNFIDASGDAEIKLNSFTKINSNKFTYDKLKSVLKVSGNVKIFDQQNNLYIQGENFTYYKLDEKIVGNNKSTIIYEDKYIIKTKDVNYYIKNKIVESKFFTNIVDNDDNTFNFDNFKFLISKKLFKGDGLVFIDKLKNEYSLDKGFIKLDDKEIIGKDFYLVFNKNTFGDNEQDPRLKGSSVMVKRNETIINNGVFTTCKKDDSCPPWEMSAKEISHDVNKKTINYKNSWLKIYDKKVFYFPKFFHPDPTVKRQSGFLIPQLLSSNSLGSSLEIPYYKVISDNKDLTFKPRLFSNSNFLISSEYRQKNKNSDHILDLGLNKSHGLTDNKSKSKTHFFSKSDVNLNLEN